MTTQTERQRLRRRLERLIGIAATEGNELVPLRNGDEIFPAMLEAVRAAEHTVDMMTFVYWRGDIAREFAEALAERARAGVRVRLLLDGFGAKEIEPELLEAMEESGVHVAWFRKPTRLSPMRQNHRCHRKVLLTDEHTAFTGGVGIAQEWCGDARNPEEWRDTHVRVRARPWTASRRPSRRTGPNATTSCTTSTTASPRRSSPAPPRCRWCAAPQASAGRTCRPCCA